MKSLSNPSPSARWHPWFPAIVFATVALALYGDVLFDDTRVPAASGTDLTMQFISWRDFGFREMATGHVPLWNPHIYCGTPYMASFQSALFYPPNWLHLFLPLGLAISWYCVLHTFLMGLFTSFWVKYRGAGIPGQVLAGVMMMCSGQYFLHAFAGHLPHLGVMVWVPLILLTLDAFADGKCWRWGLLGALALAMQILAGHPQYVFYTGLFVGLYVLLKLLFTPHRLRLLLGTAAIYFAGSLLACIQLIPGIQAAGENIRTAGLPYVMASQFSMPPVQLLTLIAPYIYGTQAPAQVAGKSVEFLYFGPGYLWELCPFVSLTGLILAALGFMRTSRANKVLGASLLLVTLVLSAGQYTPVHRFLYDHLPYFGSFRVPAKFLFFFSLLLATLAAEGIHALGEAPKLPRLRNAILLLAAALLLFGIAILIPATGMWNGILGVLGGGRDHFLFAQEAYRNPESQRLFLSIFLRALGGAIVTLAVLACMVHWMHGRTLRWCAVALAGVELVIFAAIGRGASPAMLPYPPQWSQAIADNPQDSRCFHTNTSYANFAMSLGAFEMWGYDPGVLRRYGLLISASQGIPAEEASQYLRISTREPFEHLYRMFRLKWILANAPQPVVIDCKSPMPQAVLIGRSICLPKLEDQINFAISKDFDPTTTTITQTPPSIAPAGEDIHGEVKVENIDSDNMVIDATTDKPAMLLITDNYAAGWNASPLGPSAQSTYEVMPVNVCLRGIPLQAGKHRIQLEYRPSGYVIGRWVTTFAAMGYLGLALLAHRQTKKKAGT
jgi:hypothetical protein